MHDASFCLKMFVYSADFKENIRSQIYASSAQSNAFNSYLSFLLPLVFTYSTLQRQLFYIDLLCKYIYIHDCPYVWMLLAVNRSNIKEIQKSVSLYVGCGCRFQLNLISNLSHLY